MYDINVISVSKFRFSFGDDDLFFPYRVVVLTRPFIPVFRSKTETTIYRLDVWQTTKTSHIVPFYFLKRISNKENESVYFALDDVSLCILLYLVINEHTAPVYFYIYIYIILSHQKYSQSLYYY